MIASTLVAAALATQPAPVATTPAPMAHDHGAMAAQHDVAKYDAKHDMAAGTMGCCKDGCDCCTGKNAAKAPSKG